MILKTTRFITWGVVGYHYEKLPRSEGAPSRPSPSGSAAIETGFNFKMTRPAAWIIHRAGGWYDAAEGARAACLANSVARRSGHLRRRRRRVWLSTGRERGLVIPHDVTLQIKNPWGGSDELVAWEAYEDLPGPLV